jgi:purine-binding chemotaxis protein CheW
VTTLTNAQAAAARERVYAFADELAAQQEIADANAETAAVWETWVTFQVAGETFAFPVAFVQEILRVGVITRVPDAPYPVRGIVNVRGRVIPVVDLRLRLGLPEVTEPGPSARVLIATLRGRVIGLLVDAVAQVERIDRTQVEDLPDDLVTEHSEYIRGVYPRGGDLLILLDPEKVLLITTEPAPAEVLA